MIQITKKEECCGCGACIQICPVTCIKWQEDREGFWYPKADSTRCVQCGRCEAVCPVKAKNAQEPVSEEKSGSTEVLPAAYAAYAREEEIRRMSSSGGIFSVLAEAVMEAGGVVYGAAFDENWKVRHICVEKKEQLEKLRGSKYVQSSLDGVYAQVKEQLQNGRLVLFSGTPCQTAGLRAVLGTKQEHLICVDILCHGVPSPKLWEVYRREVEGRLSGPVHKISFREKSRGWKQPSVRIDTAKGPGYQEAMQNDPYMRLFLGNLSLRPSCYACPFKGLRHPGDLTLGDLWEAPNITPDMDDDKGLSLVMVQTEAGERIWNHIQNNVIFRSVNVQEALPPDAESRRQVERHPGRETFSRRMAENAGMMELEKVLEYSIIQKIARKLRKICKKKGEVK